MPIRGLINMNLLKEELRILAVLTNSTSLLELVEGLSEQELASRLVSKEKMTKYKLRGSPKLSKILLAFGLPQKLVSLALSNQAVGNSRISAQYDDLRDQGNSIHYSSCQATDQRAKWYKDATNVAAYLDIDGDVPHLGKTLFLWISGQRMSIDGEGFKARAKLRLIYSDPDSLHNLVAVYVDKIYGDVKLLKSDLPLLKEWVKQKFGNIKIVSATSQWPEKRGFTFGEDVFCPSAVSGSQDSTPPGIRGETYHKLLSTERESYFMYKYQLRNKQCGVYQVRTGEEDLPERGVRPHITSKTRELIKTWISVLGYPDKGSRFKEQWMRGLGITLKGVKLGIEVALAKDGNFYTYTEGREQLIVSTTTSLMIVESTCGQLGFHPAVGFKTYGEIKEALSVIGLEPSEVYRTSLQGNQYNLVIKGKDISYDSEKKEFSHNGKVVITTTWRTLKTFSIDLDFFDDATYVVGYDYFGGYERGIPVGLGKFLRLDVSNLSKPVDEYKFYSKELFGNQFSATEVADGYLVKEEGIAIARVSSDCFIVLEDNKELGLLKPVPIDLTLPTNWLVKRFTCLRIRLLGSSSF
jgi:hypothetical protein